jgi:hypothetical protein
MAPVRLRWLRHAEGTGYSRGMAPLGSSGRPVGRFKLPHALIHLNRGGLTGCSHVIDWTRKWGGDQSRSVAHLSIILLRAVHFSESSFLASELIQVHH